MRNFRELEIWKESVSLAKVIYDLMKVMPEEEKYGLTLQIKKCIVSVPSNIAEGCAKTSDKDFARFLEISLGSSFELETQLILCFDFDYISEDSFLAILPRLQLIQKKIASFVNYLNK